MENRDEINRKKREYYHTRYKNNPEWIKRKRIQASKWYKTHKPNRDKVNAYRLKRKQIDSSFAIESNIRTRILKALDRNTKKGSTSTLLGCSISKLKEHLQQTAINNEYKDFNIEIYDRHEFHIDHIIPCSSFNLKCSYHQKLCFNYENLQILTAKENLVKSDSFVQV